jgi:hypothetical protein
MPMLDLGPAAGEVIGFLDGVTDDKRADPTPREDSPVAELLDISWAVAGLHVGRAQGHARRLRPASRSRRASRPGLAQGPAAAP